MQMMFLCLIVLGIFFISTFESSLDNSITREFEDIFYDDTYYLKKIQMKKFRDEIQKENSKKLQVKKSTIINFNEYMQSNKNNFYNSKNFYTAEKGKCQKIIDLTELYSDLPDTEGKIFNINLLQTILNERNYIFNDEYENLIIYSACENLFNSKCNSKFVFVSKLDYDSFEFIQNGEKIPNLEGFSIDYSIDIITKRKIFYLFGGIDSKGQYNQDLFRMEINYTIGVAKITKMGINEAKNVPRGVTENSLNILMYYVENNINSGFGRHLIFIFGGINDESISNKLWVFHPEKHTWTMINSYLTPNLVLPRKGHSSVILEYKLDFTIDEIDISKDLMKTYKMIIFGGKNESQYFNDLMVIQINYMILDNAFYYKVLNVGNPVGDIPEGREGHKALIIDNFMYIVGGCNYKVKKCFNNEIYRLNLKSTPLEWEKLTISATKKDSFNPHNINFQHFRGNFINLGNCNFNRCDKTAKLIVKDFNCDCTNIKVKQDNKSGEILACKNDITYKEKFQKEISKLEKKIDKKYNKPNNDNSNKETKIIEIKHENKFNNDGSLKSANQVNMTKKLDKTKNGNKTSLIKANNISSLIGKNKTNITNKNASNIFAELEQIKQALILVFQKPKVKELVNFDDNDLKFVFNQTNKTNTNFPKTIDNKNTNSISSLNIKHDNEKPNQTMIVNHKNKTKIKKKHHTKHQKNNETLSNKDNINKHLNIDNKTDINGGIKDKNKSKGNNLESVNKTHTNINKTHLNINKTHTNINKTHTNINKTHTNINKSHKNHKHKTNITHKTNQTHKSNKTYTSINKTHMYNNKTMHNLNHHTYIVLNSTGNIANSSIKNTTLTNSTHEIINDTHITNNTDSHENKKGHHKKHKNKHHKKHEENENKTEILRKTLESELKLFQNDKLFKFITNSKNENMNFIHIRDDNFPKIKSKNQEAILENNLQKNIIGISNNVSEIRSEIKEVNLKSNEELKSILNNMMNNIMEENNLISKKLEEFENFKNHQEKLNKENNIKCVNGYLLNDRCKCFPGFEGVACDISLICKKNCNENGVCNYGKCFCNPGFSGETCDIPDKCSNNCMNRGKCQYGKCFCDAGFSGDDCSKSLKCINNCNNRGICFTGKCLCEPGYSGPDCSKIDIDFQPCQNNCNGNGICKFEKCFCFPEFSGNFCQIKNEFSCPPFINITEYNLKLNPISASNITWSSCNGNGICKYGKCFCYPGFKGIDCSNKEECKNNCSNKGTCIKGKCICSNNSTKDDCSEEINNNFRYFNNMKFREVNSESNRTENMTIYNVSKIESVEINDNTIRWLYNGVIIFVIIFIVLLTMLLNRKEFSD